MTTPTRSLSRYGLSLLVVLGLHGALAFWALFWHPQAKPVDMPPPAVMIELAPLPPAAPKPAPPPEVVEPEPEPEPPKLVEVPKPKIAIHQPKPKPKPKPKPPKPVEKPQPKPVEEPPQEAAPPAPPAENQSKPAAQQLASVQRPSKAEISWQSRLLSHLSRYKRYPEDARRRGFEGTTKVRFSIDRNGRVLSVEVVGSSGSASLDRATLAMIRRAQPVPKPPVELLKGNSLEVVAPFVYSLDRRH